jgi:hypothetical protein
MFPLHDNLDSLPVCKVLKKGEFHEYDLEIYLLDMNTSISEVLCESLKERKACSPHMV